MICDINNTSVYYEEYGEGKPVLCIHGYWVDHRLMSGCLEPVFQNINGYKRIYLDMPGFGKSPADRRIKNANDMLEFLKKFINIVIGDNEFLLIGESFGGYLSLGLIHEFKKKIDGVMLICPVTYYDHDNKPQKQIIYLSDELRNSTDSDLKSFLEMAVMADTNIFDKYKKDILSGIKIADSDYLSNYFDGKFSDDFLNVIRQTIFDKPACIMTGKQDHVLGYDSTYKILDKFPRATFAIVDCAGHNLQIDNEGMFNSLLIDWLWRISKLNEKDTQNL